MTKEDVSPQVLAARLERENVKLAKEDKYSELRLGTLLISAISKSSWDKAKICYSKFEMAQAVQDWKPEIMTLGFIEKKMTAFFPKSMIRSRRPKVVLLKKTQVLKRSQLVLKKMPRVVVESDELMIE
jgi:hypothetical protein